MRSRYFTTGEIPIGRGFIYVNRSVEEDVVRFAADPSPAKIAAVFGCRQTGKTSLLDRVLNEVQADQCVAKVSLQCVFPSGTDAAQSQETILAQILRNTAIELDLPKSAHALIDATEGSVREKRIPLSKMFISFFESAIAAVGPSRPMIVAYDEFDSVLQFGRQADFLFDMFYAALHAESLRSIKWIVVSLNHPNNLMRSGQESKFTIFDNFQVGDFEPTSKQVIEILTSGLENAQEAHPIVEAVLRATGGQPYLTCKILGTLVATDDITLKGALGVIERTIEANRTGGPHQSAMRDPHFDFPRMFLELHADYLTLALRTYEEIRSNKRDPKSPIQRNVEAILIGSGLVSELGGLLKVKSPIYSSVFDEQWIRNTQLNFYSGLQTTHRHAGKSRPKVVVANLGGTLGMELREQSGQMEPPEHPESFFLENYPGLVDLIDPIFETPTMPTDSANLVPSDWERLAKVIYLCCADRDVAGVVVVQGTDTLAYTASAVAYALGPKLPFPVVFTGSQAPYSAVHADAQANLLRACRVVVEWGRKEDGTALLREVVVAFDDEVLRAVRTEKKDDFRFAGFHAPSEGPLAIIGENLQQRVQSQPLKTGAIDWRLRAEFEDRVLKISQYPGFRPEYLEALVVRDDVLGVVFESLGIGNLPTITRYGVMDVIDQTVNKLQKPVLITSRYPIVPEFIKNYVPASRPLQLGAVSAGDMTAPAATTKFMWAIKQVDIAIANGDAPEGQRLDLIQSYMEENRVGEIAFTAPRIKGKVGRS